MGSFFNHIIRKYFRLQNRRHFSPVRVALNIYMRNSSFSAQTGFIYHMLNHSERRTRDLVTNCFAKGCVLRWENMAIHSFREGVENFCNSVPFHVHVYLLPTYQQCLFNRPATTANALLSHGAMRVSSSTLLPLLILHHKLDP